MAGSVGWPWRAGAGGSRQGRAVLDLARSRAALERIVGEAGGVQQEAEGARMGLGERGPSPFL